MKAPTWLISAVLAVLCAGILALFTDAEVRLVRWFNCGPLAGEASRHTPLSR